MQANSNNHSDNANVQAAKTAEIANLAAKVAFLEDAQRNIALKKGQIAQALGSSTTRKEVHAKEKLVSDGVTVENCLVPMESNCSITFDEQDFSTSDEIISFAPVAESNFCPDNVCQPISIGNSYSPEPIQYFGIETIVNELKIPELISNPAYGEYRLNQAQLANLEMAERMVANEAEAARLSLVAYTNNADNMGKTDKDKNENNSKGHINILPNWQMLSDKRFIIT
jgi:hypothetical protein